jgi:hypothetical protein
MSDQPAFEPGEPASPSALRDTRWIAAAMWGAALVALLATSGAAVGGLLWPFGVGLPGSFVSYGGDEDSQDLVASAGLIVTIGIALVLIVSWWAFARATHGLIAALSDSSDTAEDAPVPGTWLAQEGGRSALSDMATYLGVTWALVVLRPAVVMTLAVFASA